MKNLRKLRASSAIVALALLAAGCDFSVSTANLSGLKTSTDKEGKSETSNFKRGDTIYGIAQVSNNPGKAVVKYSVFADEAAGLTKGEKMMELPLNVEGSMSATLTLKPSEDMPYGTYTITADMMNDSGEKKDSKSVSIKFGSE